LCISFPSSGQIKLVSGGGDQKAVLCNLKAQV
jgi:hypothetical protein